MENVNKATVIIPTTGSKESVEAIQSVLDQSFPTYCYVVCDGMEKFPEASVLVLKNGFEKNPNFKFCTLPLNVGANNFYGHRVYAAFSHLVDSKYVLFLDQDNWFDKNHVESCVKKIESDRLDWCYSLRKIVEKDGTYACDDNFESLGKWTPAGYNLVDTNSFCVKQEILINIAHAWHGKWGQDRVFYNIISKYYPKFTTTGKHTVNYRLGGNIGSVNKEFFLRGNQIAKEKYKGELPWHSKN